MVFALDELEPGDEVARTDLPGDAWRYGRTPGGYRATIVAGVPTWLDGARHRARGRARCSERGSAVRAVAPDQVPRTVLV